MEIAYIENLYRSEHGMQGRHKQIVHMGKKQVHCMDIYRWIDYQLKSYAVLWKYTQIKCL
jgi:hypothetical protein